MQRQIAFLLIDKHSDKLLVFVYMLHPSLSAQDLGIFASALDFLKVYEQALTMSLLLYNKPKSYPQVTLRIRSKIKIAAEKL
jgi:hypothetical protein